LKKLNFKLSKKFIIIINLFLIVTLMTVSVYAWFASQVDNRVDAYEIIVEADNALELSFDEVTWGGALNLADYKIGDEYVMNNIKFVEVDSDNTTFRIPQLTQKTNYAEVNTSAEWSVANENQDYLEFTVYMRSKDKMNVYLSSDSFAAPVSTEVVGGNCGNPSTYASGDDAFSKDCVVGALRVGFTNNANANYIWITNPEFHLNNLVGDDKYTMDINAGATTYSDGTGAEGGNFRWNNPKEHYYYNTSNTVTKFANKLSALPETVTTNPGIGGATHLASLTTTQDADGYYTDSVTFKVWIAGCDTEARRALVDGKFNLSLVFDTYGVD